MASFNKVILMGNLTRDPETRTTPSGLTIAKLGLAVNRRFTDKNNEQRDETTFVDVDAFGKQAEVIAKYCNKGSGILIEGRLRLDQWQDKQTGENRNKLGVVLENFQFVGGRGEGSGNSGDSDYSSAPPRRAPSRRASAPANEPEYQDNIDDDVPF